MNDGWKMAALAVRAFQPTPVRIDPEAGHDRQWLLRLGLPPRPRSDSDARKDEGSPPLSGAGDIPGA
jgi:hypothetical protein